MARHFGIPNVTGRPTSGAQPQSGPHFAQQTRRDSNVIPIQFAGKASSPPEGWRNLGRGDETPPSFIHDDREFAATCFVAGLAIVPGFFMFGLIFLGLTLFG